MSNIDPKYLIGKHFIGTVVNNIDPNPKLQRVQVMVTELFENLPTADIPWAGCMRMLFRGVSGTCAFFSVPRNGARVMLVYDKGDINAGIIIGELPDGNSNPSDFTGAGYPAVWGLVDEGGNKLIVNPAGEWDMIHHSGASIKFASNGDIQTNSPGKTVIVATGDVDVNGQNINATAAGNTTINSAGNTVLEAAGSVMVTSTGGGTCTMSSTGPININAPSVNVN